MGSPIEQISIKVQVGMPSPLWAPLGRLLAELLPCLLGRGPETDGVALKIFFPPGPWMLANGQIKIRRPLGVIRRVISFILLFLPLLLSSPGLQKASFSEGGDPTKKCGPGMIFPGDDLPGG